MVERGSSSEWTQARIRLLRAVGLCQSQHDFAKTLGVTKRTVGNAERGAHPPSLALRRALDQALDNTSATQTSATQRDRFLAAVAAAQLLPSVLTCLQSRVDTGSDEFQPDTMTMRHATAAAYLATAKLATKLGDIVLASVTADRAMTAANESEHPALVGSATYQVACALLLTGELANTEQILALSAENIASVATTTRLNCRQEEALSVRGSLLLLLAIIAARRGDHNAAQDVLREASQLAEQLGCDGNWLWTAFGPTNVAIHQLSVQSLLGNAKKAAQIAESIDTPGGPGELHPRAPTERNVTVSRHSALLI